MTVVAPRMAGGAPTEVPMHAVVLAGGPGRVLPPYETPFPKALVPLGGRHAVIEIVLRQLRAKGFRTVTLAVGHLGSLVQAYCGDGSQWDLEIDYWWEQEPLGTMGAVVAHLDELPPHFLVMNGDELGDLDYCALMTEHAARGAALSVATVERTAQIGFGLVELGGDDGRTILGFQEKPVHQVTVSAGAYAVSREALRRYAPGQPLGFDELVLDLISRGQHPHAVPCQGLWIDISVNEEYQRANDEWDELAPILLPDL